MNAGIGVVRAAWLAETIQAEDHVQASRLRAWLDQTPESGRLMLRRTHHRGAVPVPVSAATPCRLCGRLRPRRGGGGGLCPRCYLRRFKARRYWAGLAAERGWPPLASLRDAIVHSAPEGAALDAFLDEISVGRLVLRRPAWTHRPAAGPRKRIAESERVEARP